MSKDGLSFKLAVPLFCCTVNFTETQYHFGTEKIPSNWKITNTLFEIIKSHTHTHTHGYIFIQNKEGFSNLSLYLKQI